jgi:hypothetical protein
MIDDFFDLKVVVGGLAETILALEKRVCALEETEEDARGLKWLKRRIAVVENNMRRIEDFEPDVKAANEPDIKTVPVLGKIS